MTDPDERARLDEAASELGDAAVDPAALAAALVGDAAAPYQDLVALIDSLPPIRAVRDVLGRPGFWASYQFTLGVAVAATVLAAGGGAVAVFVIARRPRSPGRFGLGLLHYNFGMPHLVWAVALAALLTPSGWVARLSAVVG